MLDPRRLDRVLLASMLAAFLAVGAIRAFVSTLYYRNLATLSINASIALAVVFLASAILLAAPLATRQRVVLLASAAALGLARVLMDVLWAKPGYLLLGALATASAFVLLATLAHQARHAHGTDGARRFALGVGLALALDAALTFLMRSDDPTQRLGGLVLVLPAAAALLWLLAPAWPTPRAWTAQARGRGALLAGAAIGALLFLEISAFASPHALARWNGLPVAPLAIGTILGLAVPLVFASRETPLDERAVVLLNAGGVVAIIDHAIVHSQLLPLLLVIAQAALIVDLALLVRAAASGTLANAGAAFAVAGAVTVTLTFVFAFGLTFAYVPLSGLWKGSEKLVLPAAFLLAALPAMAIARRETERAHEPIPRRALGSYLAAPLLVAIVAILLPAAAIEAPSEGEPLRVLAFNVHQGFGNSGVVDAAIFERVLREEAPDIVALQESDTPRITSANVDIVSYLAHGLGYHEAYGPATSRESFGVGLLSKHPILQTEIVPLPSAEDNRYFLAAQLDVHGTRVWVYVVHLGLPADDRMAQTTVLLDHAAEKAGPVILAGDLNSCPRIVCPDYEGASDDVYERIVARYIDTAVATGLDANAPSTWTYDAANLTHRIDYVFVSRELNVAAVASVRSDAALAASDHVPVMAELRFASP